MSARTAASLVSVSRLGGNSASAAIALSCAPWASARSALRRLWGSGRPALRPPGRLVPRPVLARRSRADSGGSEAARQVGGRFGMRRGGLDPLWQNRVALGDAAIGPAHRRRRGNRGIEIVAERCAERLLKTLGDGDAVDDRRPEILG